jgi:hypothetical protein
MGICFWGSKDNKSQKETVIFYIKNAKFVFLSFYDKNRIDKYNFSTRPDDGRKLCGRQARRNRPETDGWLPRCPGALLRRHLF